MSRTSPRSYAVVLAMIVALVGGSIAAKEILFSGAATSVTARAEFNVVAKINKQRLARGLRPLKIDPKLSGIARSWSAAMMQMHRFDHGDFSHRLYAAVGRRRLVAENIAMTSPGARGVVKAWMQSPPHRFNILLPDARRIGVGVAIGTYHGKKNTAMVTADFSS